MHEPERSVTPSLKEWNELLRREKELTDFIEKANVGLHWVDSVGIVKWANQHELSFLGYAASEYIGQSITKFHADPPVISDILSKLGSNEELVGYPARLIAKDGSIKDVLINSSVYWEDGKFIHTRCFTRDVSAAKRVENLLADRARLADLRSEIATIIADEKTVAIGLQKCCEALVKYLGAAFARAWTLDDQKKCLELKASAGQYTHLDGLHSRVPIGEYKIGRIAFNKKAYLSNNVQSDAEVSNQEWARKEGMISFAGYPLLIGENVIGVLAMFGKHTLSETVLEELNPIASTIAQWIGRKRAEAEAYKQKEWLEVTMQSIGDAVITTDIGGNVTFLNTIAESLCGWTFADAKGRYVGSVFNIVNEQTKLPVDNPIERVLEFGKAVPLANHTVLISRYGVSIPIEDSAAPIMDATGTMIGVVLVFRNVSENRDRERQQVILLETANKARREADRAKKDVDAILHSITDGFISLNSEWNINFVNGRAADILKKSVEAMPGKNLWDIFPDEVNGTFYNEFHRAIQQRVTVRVEDFYSSLNKWIQATAYPQGSGELSIFFQDVTARKDAELEKQRSSDDFKFMAELLPQKLFTASKDGDIIYFNKKWMEFTGHTFDEIRGWGWGRFIHPEDLNRTVEKWTNVVKTGEPYEDEHRFRRHDGKYHWHLSRAFAMKDTNGDVRMWLGTNTDINELKDIQNELEVARDSEIRANKAKDEFFATLSHELRSPLTPILGWTKILSYPKTDRATQLRGVQIIERSVIAQTKLIDDILDMSRIISGKFILNMRPINIVRVVESSLEVVRHTASAKSIEISFSSDSSTVELNGDSDRLQQVVWNLLTNAVKFTPKHGNISIRVQPRLSDVEISVTDSGNGLAPEFIPKIFQRFSQFDSSSTRIHGGLGIGLSLVKTLVESHGGSVTAESEGLGKGATFRVLLPARAISALDSSGELAATNDVDRNQSQILDGIKILTVDDEPDARDMISTLLRMQGATVCCTGSAKEALDAFSMQKPDVILSDIGMPNEDGYSLIIKLRQREITSNSERVPAIALTAFVHSGERERCLTAGFDLHLSKPIDPDALIEAIRSVTKL